MNRRHVLGAFGGGATLLGLLPAPSLAGDAEVTDAIRSVFGNKTVRQGRVRLKLPKIAETGNSVPITLSVESPMTTRDCVIRACIFGTRNPRPLIVTLWFGPHAGIATFNTNIRLSGTQDVIGIAEMSDHSLWRARERVLVTVGACDALQTRY
jgi:sulfur-oxidizing protein SoxY